MPMIILEKGVEVEFTVVARTTIYPAIEGVFLVEQVFQNRDCSRTVELSLPTESGKRFYDWIRQEWIPESELEEDAKRPHKIHEAWLTEPQVRVQK